MKCLKTPPPPLIITVHTRLIYLGWTALELVLGVHQKRTKQASRDLHEEVFSIRFQGSFVVRTRSDLKQTQL